MYSNLFVDSFNDNYIFIFYFYFFSWKLPRENYAQKKVVFLIIRVVRMHTINVFGMNMVYFKDISFNVHMGKYFQMFQDVANVLTVTQCANLATGETISE